MKEWCIDAAEHCRILRKHAYYRNYVIRSYVGKLLLCGLSLGLGLRLVVLLNLFRCLLPCVPSREQSAIFLPH